MRVVVDGKVDPPSLKALRGKGRTKVDKPSSGTLCRVEMESASAGFFPFLPENFRPTLKLTPTTNMILQNMCVNFREQKLCQGVQADLARSAPRRERRWR